MGGKGWGNPKYTFGLVVRVAQKKQREADPCSTVTYRSLIVKPVSVSLQLKATGLPMDCQVPPLHSAPPAGLRL